MTPAKDASAYVTLVEILDLKEPYEACAPLIRGMLDRLAKEGVPTLESMRFYHDPAQNQLGAVITFTSARELTTHMAMVGAWPEFQRFAQAVQLIEIRVHGALPPAARAWIGQFKGTLRVFEDFLGGFVR